MQALLHNAPPLVIFLFVMSITPGPNNLMLLSSGARFGRRRSRILGITSGFLLLLLVTYAGVGAVILAYPALKSALTVACVFVPGVARVPAAAPAPSGGRQEKMPGVGPAGEATLFQLVNPKGGRRRSCHWDRGATVCRPSTQ
jgi:threonine/homoserine/homoserine lactone efflux protein